MKKNILLLLTLVLFSNLIKAQVTVTGSTGANASYATLKAAFDAINANPTQTGNNIVISISGSTTETAAAVLNQNATWTSVNIYPTTTGLSISGNLATRLIGLNGADNVTIDGRVNGTGTTKDLIITNISTFGAIGTSTIQLYNGANNNTIKYCTVKGSSVSTTDGIIRLGANPLVVGFSIANTGCLIDNNNITNSADANRPKNAIYSDAAANTITISNNYFYDFFNRGANSFGINLNSSTAASSITNNSFYETTTFVPTTGNYAYSVIYINSTVAGFTINGNYIGGSSANCTGTWIKTNARNNNLNGIYVSAGTGTPTVVQDNVINGFSWGNLYGGNFYGISIWAGDATVGTSGHPNTIGSISGTPNCTFTNSASTGGLVYPFFIAGSGAITCQYNNIGGITAANTSTNIDDGFVGIYRANINATGTISYNTIGNASNPITCSSTSTGYAQVMCGIMNSGTASTSLNINNNTIANLTNATTNTNAGTAGYVTGISNFANAVIYLNGNTIHDLTIANANTATDHTASVTGIALSSAGTSLTSVTNNIIYNLSNTYATFAGFITGIYFTGGSSANDCSGNTIYGLSATGASAGAAQLSGINFNAGTTTSTINKNYIYGLTVPNSTSAIIYGIRKATGAVTLSDNIVNLGSTAPATIYGIYETGAASNSTNLYFNTVYIGGTAASAALNSYALYSAANTNTRNFRNNIFSNFRTGGTGVHYSPYILTAGGSITIDYNDYYTAGATLGYYGAAKTDIASWRTATTQDGNSLNIAPSFVSAGSSFATDYKVSTYLPAVTGTGITIDYGSTSRNSIPTMGAWESLNSWKGTSSSAWNVAANWTGGDIPASDGNILFFATPNNNCLLDADHSVTNITNASTYNLVTNGHKLTIKGAISQTSTGKIDASTTGSTVEFAGNVTQSIPSGAFYNNNVYNLTINNTANVILSGTLNLLNTLSATSGRLDAYSNSPTFVYAGTSAQTIGSQFLSDKATNLTINNAAGVSVGTDFTVNSLLTVNSGNQLIIPATKLMNVPGTISNNAGVDGIYIGSSSSAANGTLIFHNDQASGHEVSATVEMYSKASKPTTSYKWQFFGIPLRSITSATPTFDGSYVRQNYESGTTSSSRWVQLTNSSSLSSFTGYEITQVSPKTVIYQGILENSDFNSGQLSYTTGATYSGQHLIANSYTAAIDISKIVFGSTDAGIIENSVYLYNTGSYDDWVAAGSGTAGSESVTPGQWVSIPYQTGGVGGLPTQIPSMQAFLVKANSSNAAATISIPYTAVANTVVKNTTLQRVKATDKICTRIDVKGANYGDQMWLISNPTCSHAFDNGWDGYKFLGTAITPQIYAMDTSGDYQVCSVDDVNNTDIGFMAGGDTNYTLTFTHENTAMQYNAIYLLDLQTNVTTDITASGTTYSFSATSTVAPVRRFRILTSTVATDTTNIAKQMLTVFNSQNTIIVQNKSDERGDLYLYDFSGRIVQKLAFAANSISTLPINVPIGSYISKAITKGNALTTKLLLGFSK